MLASFFQIEAREYANFTLDAAARSTVRNVILGFCVGILIAALYAFYQKNVPGGIIRALLRAQALSAENAKTLSELGLDKNPLFAFELKHNKMLQRMLRTTTEGEAANAPTRYYIPSELKYRAEVRFDQRGSGPIGLILTVALTLVIGILLIRLLPAILGAVDGMMG